jgi:Mrp family chromosome partitioning ATPase
MGSRVLLLEADLRRPTLAKQLGISSGLGLSDMLIGAASLPDATQTLGLDAPVSDRSKEHTLDILTAGAAVSSDGASSVEQPVPSANG